VNEAAAGERAPRTPGRPRNPDLDRAIRTAVLDVLATEGYPAVTMDNVAMVAGVSKASIYRRWQTKTDLLVSVIESASDLGLVAADTGSLRDDLVALLSSLVDVLAGPCGAASRALLTAGNAEPALATAFRFGPMARWGEAFQAAFRRAAARGEVDDTAGRSLTAEIGPSILLTRWLVTDQPIDGTLAEAIVDDVMLPLLQRSLPRP
jgi:AcrR family transcriptional regulator